MPLFEGSPGKVEQATDGKPGCSHNWSMQQPAAASQSLSECHVDPLADPNMSFPPVSLPLAVPPLPGSGGDFSLKSWPSLSPPPNFQLPDGFETGLSPMRKTAAATLTGGPKAAPHGAPAPSGGVPLGPTDFSLLIAGFGSEGAAAAPAKQPGAASAAAAQPRPQQQQQQQQQQPAPALGLPQDTLFGGLSLFGLPPPAGQAGQGSKAAAAGMGASGGLAPLPDQELAELTFDFGSLLGVDDAPPSWMGGPGLQAQQAAQQQQVQQQQQQQQQQQAAPLVGDRPFAALFGK